MKKFMMMVLAAVVLMAGGLAQAGPVELWVNNVDSNRYERHALNPFNPTLFDSINMADQAAGITMGPGGIVYIADAVDNLQRHDVKAVPGSSLINSYSLPATAGEKGLAIGPDGNLYVQTLSGSTMTVRRLDAATGAALGTFATYTSAGAYDFIFGANGHLYTSSNSDHLVRHFNASGVFQDSVSVNNVRGLAFGPDGRLYVASRGDNVVYAFDLNGTGALASQVTYFALDNVRDLDFNPVDGHAFAVDVSNVVEFDEVGNLVGIVSNNTRTRVRVMITPEPASMALLGMGGLMMLRRRR